MIDLLDICHGYEGRGVLHGANVRFRAGRLTALLGPNGAGKSTILRIAAGELRQDSGRALFKGVELAKWKPRELARTRALLPQASQLDFPFSVAEVALLGRAPHMDGRERPEDLQIAREALALAGMESFAARDYTTLSGGERQRVQLARVLAQVWRREGCALLLDEPVANLDPAHQHDTLSLAREWAGSGACVVAILHDANLALRHADDAVVLHEGRVFAQGAAQETLTPALMETVFGVACTSVETAQGEPPFLAIRGRK